MAYTYEETLSLFLEEAREGLAVFERSLLSLEKASDDEKPELVNRALRVVHSIKGSAGYFGFSAIDELAQALELVLGQVRAGELVLDSESIGILLVGGDRLAWYIENTSDSDDRDSADIIASIASIIDGKPSETSTKKKSSRATKSTKKTPPKKAAKTKESKSPSAKAKTKKATKSSKSSDQAEPEKNSAEPSSNDIPEELFEISPSVSLAARSHGEDIFAFHLDFDGTVDPEVTAHRNTELMSLGNIVDKPFDNWVRFRTVLDHDLLVSALSVPETAIIKVPLDARAPINTPARISTPEAISEVQEAVLTNEEDGNAKEKHSDSVDTQMSERKASTVRISVHLLDELVNLAGELVLSRNQIERAGDLLAARDENLQMVIQRLSAVTSQLREKIMETRMQRVDTVLRRLPRVVRDLSVKLSKEVKLEISGGEVELDRTILEAVSEPLVHMVRNALDHGFETPEERIRAGKPSEGTLRIEAFHAGDFVLMKFSDNGRGVNHRSIITRAINKGLIRKSDAAAMGAKDALNLLMSPGFSTKDEVTSVSGLGVGLDVVKTQIERLGGSVAVDSKLGEGTTFTLRLPVTLAIVPAVFVKAGNNTFGVLLKQLQKLERIRADQRQERIITVNGVPALKTEGQLIPLVRLADVIGMNRTYISPADRMERTDRRQLIADRRAGIFNLNEDGSLDKESNPGHNEDLVERTTPERRTQKQSTMQIVILGHEDSRFGVIVDAILDNEEIVVKPCPREFSFNPCYMGTTILGDGNLAAILDPEGMIRIAGLNLSAVGKDIQYQRDESQDAQTDSDARNYLIYETGEGVRYGMPLPSVGKLERLSQSECHIRGGAELFQREDRTLRLIRISDFVREDTDVKESTQDTLYAIIPYGYEQQYAVLATKIVDTIDLNTEATSYSETGLENRFLEARFALNDELVLVPNIDEIIRSLSSGGKNND